MPPCSSEDGLSHEAIYRQTWATFVDNAITQHQPSGAIGSHKVIELRDLMQLEEVLSKVQMLVESDNTEGEPADRAKDTYTAKRSGLRHTGRDRNFVQAISGLPPLFQNPRASFLDTLYPPVVYSNREDTLPEVSSLEAESIELASELRERSRLPPGRRATILQAEVDESWQREPHTLREPDSSASASWAGDDADPTCVIAGMPERVGRRDRTPARHQTFHEYDLSGDENDRRDTPERQGQSSSSAEVAQHLSPELLTQMESLSIGPSPAVLSSSLSSRQDWKHDEKISRDDVVLNDASYRGGFTSPHDDEMTVTRWSDSHRGHSNERSRVREVGDNVDASLTSSAMSLSLRLDAMHIDDVEGCSSVEGRPSFALLQENDCEPGFQLSRVSSSSSSDDRSFGGECAKSDEKGSSSEFADLRSSPVRPDRHSANDAIVSPRSPLLQIKDLRFLNEVEQSVSARHKKSLQNFGHTSRDEDKENTRIVSDHDASPVCPSRYVSTARTPSDDGLSEQPRARSIEIGRSLGDSGAEETCIDSPEIARLGPLSDASNGLKHEKIDRSALGPAEDTRITDSSAVLSNNISAKLSQSRGLPHEERTLESGLSPSIVDSYTCEADAVLPKALMDHVCHDDVDGCDDSNWREGRLGDLSPVRSSTSIDGVGELERSTSSQGERWRVADGVVPGREEKQAARASWARSRRSNPLQREEATIGLKEGTEAIPPITTPLEGLVRGQENEFRESLHSSSRRDLSSSRDQTRRRDSLTPAKHYGDAPDVIACGDDGPDSINGSLAGSPPSIGEDGRVPYKEEESLGSFTESEAGRSIAGSETGGSIMGHLAGADASLLEGTPRRCGARPEEDLAGFYAPLAVENLRKAPKDNNLSSVQRRTLQWMAWREDGYAHQPGSGGGSTRASELENIVKGGVVGHLSAKEALPCILALIRSDGAAEDKSSRKGRIHCGSDLPHGATLVVTSTKDDAERWSHAIGSSLGLSTLTYTMPLKERRRLSAKQAAAYDVVVTTYDILKAKEVPRVGAAAVAPTAGHTRTFGEWCTRRTTDDRGSAPRAMDQMVSILHGVRWHRVVADGAQMLTNQRSARAVAVLRLVGGARWCLVERENMANIEGSSERMRSLTAFLGVPDEVPLVEAAGCLFFRNRPEQIASLRSRGSSADMCLSDDRSSQNSRCASQTRAGREVEKTLTPNEQRSKKATEQVMIRTGRVSGTTGASSPISHVCRDGSEKGGVGPDLPRKDVVYTAYSATTLRLERSQNARSTRLRIHKNGR